MPDTLDDRIRSALGAEAHAAGARGADAEPDLPAAFGRRRRRRRAAASRVAVAGLAIVALVAGAVVWRASGSSEGTVTGPQPAGEGALPVTLPDGYTFTVTVPPGAPDPVVSTSGLVALDGCCPDASVTFTPAAAAAPVERPGTTLGEPVGSWDTATGLHLTLYRRARTAATASAGASFEDVRTITGRVGGYDMVIGTFAGGSLDGVEAARAATADLAVEVGDHGFPVLGAGSRRLPSGAAPPVTGPGVIVVRSLTDNPHGTSAQVDLGTSSPSLSVFRSTCSDRSLPTPTTAGDGLPVASTARCFPDAGVIAIVQGAGPQVTAADIEDLASSIDVGR